jgi:hypothetical protein
MLSVVYDECCLCWVLKKPCMLNVVMLNVIMLNVIILNVIMLNVIMLSVMAKYVVYGPNQTY